MKTLSGLKVEALAVNTQFRLNFRISMGYLLYKEANPDTFVSNKVLENYELLKKFIEHKGDTPDFIDKVEKLPKGEWTILGRADELSHSDCFQLVQCNGWGCLLNYSPDATPDNKYTFLDEKASWQSYMEANNLTNQLILIKR